MGLNVGNHLAEERQPQSIRKIALWKHSQMRSGLVIISACHSGGRGSNPAVGNSLFFIWRERLNLLLQSLRIKKIVKKYLL